ncbi:hemerythrin domain-containing protein [[Actinomadura] parvosata]|uniref:hemerythrin domain-containing protein n=1 Tax=[Actinomadura] parvosata TaxID=1955412 RepID=UPI00406C01BA
MRAALHEAFERDLARLACVASLPGSGQAPAPGRWAWFRHFLRVHWRADRDYLWPVLRAKAAAADLALLDLLTEEHQAIARLIDAIDDALRSAAPDQVWAAFSNLMIRLTRHHRHESHLAAATAGLFTHAERVALYWERRRLVGIRGAGHFYPWLLDSAPPAACASILRHLPPTDRLLYHAVWRPRYVRANLGDRSPGSRILT